MTTTEEILARLAGERAEHEGAGRLAEVQRVDQQVIAYQTIARLVGEATDREMTHDAVVSYGLQLGYWIRQVDELPDELQQPGPRLVDEQPQPDPQVADAVPPAVGKKGR